jgi:hypothetical protein
MEQENLSPRYRRPAGMAELGLLAAKREDSKRQKP